jgi:hypothetical protein
MLPGQACQRQFGCLRVTGQCLVFTKLVRESLAMKIDGKYNGVEAGKREDVHLAPQQVAAVASSGAAPHCVNGTVAYGDTAPNSYAPQVAPAAF